MALLKLLLSLPYHIIASMYAILETFFPFLPSPFRRLTSSTNTQTYSEKTHSFFKLYEKNYSESHPTFYTQSYRQLINEMKQNLNMALVYLHSEQHQDTPQFCKETLANPHLIQFIQSKQIPFYIGPIHFQEPFDVASLLNVVSYPFIALFGVSNIQGSTKPIEIFRSEGFVHADTLTKSLKLAVEKHESLVNPLRVERDLLESERKIREMQDQAYLNSLKHDQDKKRKLEEAKLLEQQKKEALEKKKNELANFIQSRISRRKALQQLFLKEPSMNTIQIQFKFPDGTRTRRSFLLSDSVLQLYQYIDTLDPLDENTLDEEGMNSRIEKLLAMEENEQSISEIEKSHGFILISMYPRQTLDDLDGLLENVLGKHGATVAVELY